MVSSFPIETFPFGWAEVQTADVTGRSLRGTPYRRHVSFGVPKIPPGNLSSVVFLYKSVEDARAGTNIGGSGFLIGVNSVIPGKGWLYVVTNWHVACRLGASIIRVNTLDGGIDIMEFDPAEWSFLPEYDIAVIQVNFDFSVHQVKTVPESAMLQETMWKRNEIGPGDDVFMMGRFVDFDGRAQNVPAVRFGNISMNPVPLLQTNGRYANSFVVDMHSRTGFSGSAVFVYRTPGYDLSDNLAAKKVLLSGTNLFLLLGIHWGQFRKDGKYPSMVN